MNTTDLDPTWIPHIDEYLQGENMQNLKKYLLARHKQGAHIYPPPKLWFNAFNTTPFNQVKVVILGQDPYHQPNQAHGLSFSVLSGNATPPSLRNIFAELKSDLNINNQKTDLTPWAKQGVLLLNAILTVEESNAGCHANRGWEDFTDHVIRKLNVLRDKIVFILWGKYAQKKGAIIDDQKHYVIKDVHPSPLSASRGFFGSSPFSKTNNYLQLKNIKPINWQL